MMTWILWRALRHPPLTHPLFRRTLHSPSGGIHILDEAVILRTIFRMMSLVLVVAVFALAPIILTSILGAPILLLLIIQIFGVRCAARSGSAIASEQERGTYDLISMLPHGSLGVNWLMGSGCLHRGSMFIWLHGAIRFVMAFLVCILVVGYTIAISIAVSELGGNVAARNSTAGFVTLSNYASLVTAFYFDYVQSIVVGSLVGMIVPSYIHNRFDARLGSVSIYILLQIVAYLVVWFLAFAVLPELYQRLAFSGWQAEITLPFFRVAIFYLVREGVITVLWHMLGQRLNANSAEIALIVRQAVP